MPTKVVTVTFGPNQNGTVELNGTDTTFRILLNEFVINGVQGVDVGESFTLRLRDNGGGSGLCQNSFQQISDVRDIFGPNQGNFKPIGGQDIPVYIDASPTTYHEYNNPRVLCERACQTTKYSASPELFYRDGVTKPIFTSATVTLTLIYGPSTQNTTDYETIRRAFAGH